MTTGRELLDIAAEYVEARRLNDIFRVSPVEVAEADLDEIAGRWEAALGDYISNPRPSR